MSRPKKESWHASAAGNLLGGIPDTGPPPRSGSMQDHAPANEPIAGWLAVHPSGGASFKTAVNGAPARSMT